MAKNGGGKDDATNQSSDDDKKAEGLDPDNAKLKQATKNRDKVETAQAAATEKQIESTAADAEAARAEVSEAEKAAKVADDAVAEAKAAAQKARLKLDAATRRAQEKANHAKVTGELALKPGEKFIVCMVPREYTLTLDDCSRVHIKPGLRKLPASVAEHWYSKANGVTVAED